MSAAELTRRIARRMLPESVRAEVRRRLSGPRPVHWGSLRRTRPVSTTFGLDRGQCIDRYYIEAFLGAHAQDVHGRVLEVADRTYTRRFGADRVAQSDVLHATQGAPDATIVADLTSADAIADNIFDCLLLTQTLQFIYDMPAALGACRRILAPGGVVLATFAGISQVSRYDMDRWGDYWRVTDASAGRLFGDVFGPANVDVTCYGNVLAACAMLQGLAVHELNASELDHRDPDYPVVVAVRAVKEGGS